jgi:ABC-type taurine transport system ATPase subunit
VGVAQLSQGTADQLFLAARLGLVRLVTMDRRPPIILDDPFVTFDAERAERALGLLKEVASELGFQVILLTCSERFDAIADELVILEGPAADGPRVPAGWVSEPAGWVSDSAAAMPDPVSGLVDPFRLGDRADRGEPA